MFVFLDIDGVLNKSSQWNSSYPLNDGCIDEFCSYINSSGGRIILTSSWRLGFLSSGNPKNTPQIRTLEAKLRERGVRILGTTRDMGSRAREVNLFVKKYPDEKYVIIDDEEEEYRRLPESIKEHLYIVNAKNGFTRKDAKELLSRFGTDLPKEEDDDKATTGRMRFLKRRK